MGIEISEQRGKRVKTKSKDILRIKFYVRKICKGKNCRGGKCEYGQKFPQKEAKKIPLRSPVLAKLQADNLTIY